MLYIEAYSGRFHMVSPFICYNKLWRELDHISKDESAETEKTQGFPHYQAALCDSAEILTQVFPMTALSDIMFKGVKRRMMLSQGWNVQIMYLQST